MIMLYRGSSFDPIMPRMDRDGNVLILLCEEKEKEMEDQAVELLRAKDHGVLSTTYEGSPFGSVMPFSLDKEGNVIIFISDLALHTKNLEASDKCSLTVFTPDKKGDIFNGSRVTLIGKAKKVESTKELEELYFKRHPQAKKWKDFDFNFYKLEVKDIYFVGGFGNIGWVDKADYVAASKK